MEGKFCFILIALLASHVFSIPADRLKRSYNTHEHGAPVGYGTESGERDASLENSAPCGILENSDSREHGYSPDGHSNHERHRGGSTSVKAAAAASASSYS